MNKGKNPPKNSLRMIISRLTKDLRNGDTSPTNSHSRRKAKRTKKAYIKRLGCQPFLSYILFFKNVYC